MINLQRIAVPLVLVGVTVLLFDLVAYFVVPEELTRFAVSYRKTWLLTERRGQPTLARSDVRGYYRADDRTGFDIAPNARATDEFGEGPIEIFSNSIGCFDRNELATLRAAREYHYFGGDSFMWGFAPYDSKLATVWERATGKVAAKCGVSHTGQAHQLEKLKQVAAAVGRMPATVFVGFYVNDPTNDAAFPHTTVIDGYVVDTAYVHGDEIVRADIGELRDIVTRSIRELERPLTAVERIKACVWVFSLSANMLDYARIVAMRAASQAGTPAQGGTGAAVAPRPTSKFGANLYNFYDPRTMKTRYAIDPKTEANRAAIRRWAAHARENGYRLVFLLFPLRPYLDDTEYFGQVRAFLDATGIEYLDLTPLFKAEKLTARDLHWPTNDHWSPNGNRIVGRLLAARYP